MPQPADSVVPSKEAFREARQILAEREEVRRKETAGELTEAEAYAQTKELDRRYHDLGFTDSQ